MREGIALALKFKQSGHRCSTIQGCRPQVIVFLSVPATYQYLSILLQNKEKLWLYMTYSNQAETKLQQNQRQSKKKIQSN
jgi:hypothetical protein